MKKDIKSGLMKKFILILLSFIVFIPSSFASRWVEILEKQYIDFESIEIYPQKKIIKFWIKALRKSPQDKFDNKDYWYSVEKWALSCSGKYSRLEAINFYDLKEKLIYNDSMLPEWNLIVPDSNADAYYRLFCLVPFNENPLLKHLAPKR